MIEVYQTRQRPPRAGARSGCLHCPPRCANFSAPTVMGEGEGGLQPAVVASIITWGKKTAVDVCVTSPCCKGLSALQARWEARRLCVGMCQGWLPLPLRELLLTPDWRCPSSRVDRRIMRRRNTMPPHSRSAARCGAPVQDPPTLLQATPAPRQHPHGCKQRSAGQQAEGGIPHRTLPPANASGAGGDPCPSRPWAQAYGHSCRVGRGEQQRQPLGPLCCCARCGGRCQGHTWRECRPVAAASSAAADRHDRQRGTHKRAATGDRQQIAQRNAQNDTHTAQSGWLTAAGDAHGHTQPLQAKGRTQTNTHTWQATAGCLSGTHACACQAMPPNPRSPPTALPAKISAQVGTGDAATSRHTTQHRHAAFQPSCVFIHPP